MLIYSLLTHILFVLIYPVAYVMSLFGHGRLLERFTPPEKIIHSGGKRIWIHSASMGESIIAFSMASEIKKNFPDSYILISTVTGTGKNRVKELNLSSGENTVDQIITAPFDCPFVTNRYTKRIMPDLLILVETELWPSMIYSVGNYRAPIVIINGKLSRRGFRRYIQLKFLMRDVLSRISLFCVQSRSFSRRFAMLGAPEEKIEIIGNIKFDSLPSSVDSDPSVILSDFGIPDGYKIFVAGSTRPGEEEVLCRAFSIIREQFPQSLMILAPRHLNRIQDVEKIISDNGLKYLKRTSGTKFDSSDHDVMILDTMGELVNAISIADAAFVGGSLRNFGGHNPLEPAALGIPVFFGQYMEQTGFKELLSAGAAELAHDEHELAEGIIRIFGDDDAHRKMGGSAKKVVERFRGALETTLKCMRSRKLI
jgi:3-deoxy-D-manno-octulosonic-acid transferase